MSIKSSPTLITQLQNKFGSHRFFQAVRIVNENSISSHQINYHMKLIILTGMLKKVMNIAINILGGSSSNLTALSYPGAGIQAMFGIGDRFSMFLSDTPVDGYMLDIIQENSRRFTSIELPDCR